MYLTMQETAEYLELPEEFIRTLIKQKKIRAVFDGEQYIIYRDQFNHHMEQMKKLKQRTEQENNEPLLEDYDYKDED
jgi:excisionase family DNA binding protein